MLFLKPIDKIVGFNCLFIFFLLIGLLQVYTTLLKSRSSSVGLIEVFTWSLFNTIEQSIQLQKYYLDAWKCSYWGWFLLTVPVCNHQTTIQNKLATNALASILASWGSVLHMHIFLTTSKNIVPPRFDKLLWIMTPVTLRLHIHRELCSLCGGFDDQFWHEGLWLWKSDCWKLPHSVAPSGRIFTHIS